MAYNPYGVPGYGPPPSFGSYPGASHPPGMAPPPGLGPPPGMSSAPGMAPPPGVQPLTASTQANRPSGLPAFQPPPNLPNINFNAPVIRLGSTAPPMKSGTPLPSDRRDSHAPTGNRPGLGMDRNLEQSRAQLRENMQALVPPTSEECLKTIGLQKIPSGVGGEDGIQKLLSIVGRLRRWDSAHSHLEEDKGMLFGFAQYEDPESLSAAIDLLKEIQVPVSKQAPTENPPRAEEGTDTFEGIEKVKLDIAVDPNTVKYLESWKSSQGEDPAVAARLTDKRENLKQYVQSLFYPSSHATKDSDGDTPMTGGMNGAGDNVEVINIPIAQEDELADIPADMRETVAKEIAAFRERSNQRDMERSKQEEEHEERERRRNGAPKVSRLGSPQANNSNMIPLGPRGVLNAPSGPRGNRGIDFVNGGTSNGYNFKEEDDTDASDSELYEREQAKKRAEEDKMFVEAERKWLGREKMKDDALKREEAANQAEIDGFARKRAEQLEKEKNWDDEREAAQRKHLYYRDHAQWVKQRAAEREEEARNDDKDRQAEQAERRKFDAEMEQARGMADSFLERQAEEMERRSTAASAPAPAPQERFKISFGAAAQRAQARAAPVRTMADIEGLLDDQEEEQTTKRQLVPIKFEPITDTKTMSEEDIQNAVKALAQEIPVDREGLWAWDVKWDYLEDSVIREKLRPFVEKKVVEFLGVQEEFLVDIVAEHIQKHGKPGELVETLREALDEDAEDLVKKLWRMVIFFTESEKRGLPA
ncbi:RNA-binding protein 25 [Rhypophila decipiens]|uniref:RNA-binding protein 25 n=1 Tax=Rhypophila decipiens TaxID=261697 RepID=A0AAN7B578_9PEZI|nr:RNA-binding protein 25 [Rhypophila decipiens]